MHSLSLELQETTNNPIINNNSVKSIGSSSYIPPITAASANGYPNATAVIPMKLHKSLKKHEIYANLTNKSSITTEHPLVKETTVIDQNVTDVGLNITDNQTFVNTSFNAINRAENLSYISEDNSMNQTIVVNSERIGVENQENIKGSLTAAGITGITLGCVSIIGIICAVSFVMYRNYGFNRPQVLNDRCSNPDSSGYIDDSTVRVSLNNILFCSLINFKLNYVRFCTSRYFFF